ncbi:2-oxoglutarate and iron-dependent oxygenase JMJD4 isoform X2 [Pseudophryne corroboree]|uniref:2-oxoglutarate and iron-dependent oxygenase JMJD4 isoform X2 n=1 Tax=Pseudophryne corroboree TaxID=495146 RepID=UPI003081AE3F
MDGKPESEPQIIPSTLSHIDFIDDPENFSYNEFFSRYMLANTPCLFSSKFTQSWGSRKSWVTSEGKPNWAHLLQNFGDAVVPVANCDVKEYNANPKEQIPLQEYISYWRDYTESACQSPKGCLYLKDWHMRREFPGENVYDTPVYFSSDWLNEYWDAITQDDYRFVYMGPSGSWTPFHADVFRSYSWSANICGRKKWLLFPPGQEEYLRDCHGCLPYDVTSPVLQDTNLYPNYNRCCPPLEVLQEAGEIIFVPSVWHHQVYNMVIMKSCTGIDYKEFYTFLKTIAEHRIRDLENAPQDCPPEGSVDTMAPGPQHAHFDIGKIADILLLLINNQDFQKVDKEALNPPPGELLSHLHKLIDRQPSPC